jgi:hypothetical protein
MSATDASRCSSQADGGKWGGTAPPLSSTRSAGAWLDAAELREDRHGTGVMPKVRTSQCPSSALAARNAASSAGDRSSLHANSSGLKRDCLHPMAVGGAAVAAATAAAAAAAGSVGGVMSTGRRSSAEAGISFISRSWYIPHQPKLVYPSSAEAGISLISRSWYIHHQPKLVYHSSAEAGISLISRSWYITHQPKLVYPSSAEAGISRFRAQAAPRAATTAAFRSPSPAERPASSVGDRSSAVSATAPSPRRRGRLEPRTVRPVPVGTGADAPRRVRPLGGGGPSGDVRTGASADSGSGACDEAMYEGSIASQNDLKKTKSHREPQLETTQKTEGR